MVRTMYLRRCFYKASLEAKTLTFLSRCVRVSFCASSAENIIICLQCVYIYGNILCAVDSCLSEKDIEEQLSL